LRKKKFLTALALAVALLFTASVVTPNPAIAAKKTTSSSTSKPATTTSKPTTTTSKPTTTTSKPAATTSTTSKPAATTSTSKPTAATTTTSSSMTTAAGYKTSSSTEAKIAAAQKAYNEAKARGDTAGMAAAHAAAEAARKAADPSYKGSADGSGWTNTRSGNTTPGERGSNNNVTNNPQPPAAYAGTQYKNQQPLQINLANGQKVTVLGDVFGAGPNDGRMALSASGLSASVRAALDAAGIPKEGGTYLIHQAYGIAGVSLGWQQNANQKQWTYQPGTLGEALTRAALPKLVNAGYTNFNSAYIWAGSGIATLTLSNPSGGNGGSSGGGGGGSPSRTVTGTEYHGTVSVSKTPTYVFTAWHRRPNGELADMKVDVSWSNFRKVIRYSDGTTSTVPVSVTKVEAYHVIERYDDKGQMYVWPVGTLGPVTLGSSGHIKQMWQYERAGKPGSMVYYLLRLDTGDTVEVTFEVPVNGFSTMSINPDEPEMADKIAPIWYRSPKDAETVNF